MKLLLYFLYIYALWEKVKSENCANISPKKASDCILSDQDTKRNYKYCCYERVPLSYNTYKCQPYTKNDYQTEIFTSNELGSSTVFECNPTPSDDENPFLTDCSGIKNPTKSSECVLSDKDKINFKYCCFVDEDTKTECEALTQETYEIESGAFEVAKLFCENCAFKCNSKSSSKFLYLDKKYFIILLMFNALLILF